MAKLRKLLAKQEALQTEVNATRAFVERVTGHGTLVMTAVGEEGSDGIVFTPADLGLELQVLKPIYAYLEELEDKLEKVDRKVAALDELAG
ncbi:hypothetical protein PYDG_00054 [Pseudoalteromonas phage pYD6-A]|uniref:Uncharacterized protein n=1 Tax=Pseudoalteromonas phage pYD6-A TaxID=754052 RepID=M4SQK1_9CAUD|nr:hypothetical protein PYDG_00054 [Pseudoalteromonas phage pYD6-A]AGH57585.1 hypothetical protein PYDG_00054 [Pseudoalteromonas phage pYD6-A]